MSSIRYQDEDREMSPAIDSDSCDGESCLLEIRGTHNFKYKQQRLCLCCIISLALSLRQHRDAALIRAAALQSKSSFGSVKRLTQSYSVLKKSSLKPKMERIDIF